VKGGDEPSDGALRISIRLPHSRCFASPTAILRVAELAEELGFWGVTVEDHFLLPRHPCAAPDPADGRSVYESLTTLAFVAARTTRVKLITGVVVVPYRHPILLAKETATIDALSGGRLILGVGVGALRRRMSAEQVNLSSSAEIATREFDALGVHGDRGRLADEYLAALVQLWSSDPASFEGRHVAFESLDLYPRPTQARIPIWIGGRSDKALRRAARHAGWFPSQCSADYLVAGRERVIAYAAEDGMGPPTDFGPSNAACVMADDGTARETMERLYGYYFTTREAMLAATFTGSPDTIAARMRDYRAAGATFLDLRLLPHSTDAVLDQLRLIAGEVLPAIG
jgi:alkanesulfonate monooxygenase SsuD/methylene tetrahydromethanopterin reductase-like flavin-dependent oxidoreductase (luciferase family)